MTALPTTPGSLILEGEPKFHPEDLSRYMGSVWQLHDDGKWHELTDNGKYGAVMGPGYFDADTTVLYTAPQDTKPYEELRRAEADLDRYEGNLKLCQLDIKNQRRLVENLRKACGGRP